MRRGKTLKRTVGSRGAPKQSFLIVCEGARTEPNYFKAFKVTSATVEVEGSGYNTLSLVDYTKNLVKSYEKDGFHFDQVWCVFDRDDFSSTFNEAIQKAESLGYYAAYSNEAFELWYLLHFIYFDTEISRHDYIEKLSQHIGYKYKKNNREMYDELLEKQDKAIRHAERLLQNYSQRNPNRNNPSTTVHLLVKELNRYV
ncbi:MAG: RloB family protein [Spirochaetia bacterium]